MSRAAIILPILLGIIVVLWGCSPYQSASNAPADKSLESRVEKLEKELKAAKDQNAIAAADLKAEQGKRVAAEKERDAMKMQVKARGDELAKAQTDLDGLRKGLKDLLGKADAALAPLEPSGVTLSVK
jgi:chromosome segregation ATPase